MTKVLRLVGTALAGGVAAFFVAAATLTVPGCGEGDDTPDAAVEYCEPNVPGCCKKASQCGENQFDWICSSAGSCIPLCDSSKDCAQGEICEDAVCRPPACGNDDECGSGQQCLGGKCEAAPQASAVDSCQVLPEVALVKTGATKTFTVVAKDASGKTLAYKGEVTWTVDESARGAVDAGVLTGGAQAGTVKVQAKVGSKDCTAASVENFAAPTTGKVRVIVADLATQKPVSDVKVSFNGADAVDAADGVIEFDEVDGPFDVHAYPADDEEGTKYAWVSVIGTTSKDILLYTKKSLEPARFTGNMSARSFDNLSDVQGNIHLALQGGSIAGNIFDIELSSLIGELVETQVDIGGLKEPVPLPEGTVIGLGEQMFRGDSKNPFAIVSSAGVRTLWGLGGNVGLNDVMNAVGPALGGGDIDIGGILTKLLPMLGRLQSGALTGVVAEPGATTDINGTDGLSKLKLDTLMRLRVEASLPDLPTYLVAGKKTEQNQNPDPVLMPFEGAVVLGGALNGTQGLVPMGLTAGIDALPENSPDGKVDPDSASGTEAGKVALRLAPLHSGMETSRYVVLALAASFGGLLGGGEEGDGPGLVLSGLVNYPETLSFDGGKATELSLGDSFLDVPNLPSITGRTLSPGSKVEGAAFQRLSVGDAEGGEWLVYFAPKADNAIALPAPPAGLDDRFVVTGDEQPQTLLHSVRLSDASLTYDKVIEFGSDNLDDLSLKINAFSLIEIER